MKNHIKESLLFIGILILIVFSLSAFMNSRFSPFGYNIKRYPNIQEATFNSDLIFLGSSQTYSGFNPEIFDKNLKINSYNLGTPAEVSVVTYYRFKDAVEKSSPKVAIVDIYPRTLRSEINSRYIRQWFDSLSYSNKIDLASELSLGDRVKLFLNLSHMDEKIIEVIMSFSQKRLEGYKGFVSSKNRASLLELKADKKFQGYLFEMNDNVIKNMKYLDKIIDLAEEKNIKLIFVTTPLPSTSLQGIENYNEINLFISNHLKKRNVDYYDFNVLKKPVFIDEEDFEDSNHLNYFGAIKISDYISKNILDEEMFK